jgi:hypothetical protein
MASLPVRERANFQISPAIPPPAAAFQNALPDIPLRFSSPPSLNAAALGRIVRCFSLRTAEAIIFSHGISLFQSLFFSTGSSENTAIRRDAAATF